MRQVDHAGDAAKRGLAARRCRNFRVTTGSRHRVPVTPNVLTRRSEQLLQDTAWVTDIISTDEDWHYVAIILDRCSRRGHGWDNAAAAESFFATLRVEFQRPNSQVEAVHRYLSDAYRQRSLTRVDTTQSAIWRIFNDFRPRPSLATLLQRWKEESEMALWTREEDYNLTS